MDVHSTAASLLCVDGEDILAKLRDSPSNRIVQPPSQQLSSLQQAGSGSFVREGSSFGPSMLDHTQSGSQTTTTINVAGTAAAAQQLEEEEMVEDISLKNLVIDVSKHNDNYMMDGDDAPTKSRSDMQNGGSLVDEPTHECTSHKKQRKERFLQQDAATGEWACREGATCKAASSESKREKKRSAAAVAAATGGAAGSSMMSYGDASNLSNVSISLLAGGGAPGMNNLSQPHAGRSATFSAVGGSGQQQQQTMFLCSVHRKMRSARNMAYANGSWMCLPHMQCQMPSNERSVVVLGGVQQQQQLQPTSLMSGLPPHLQHHQGLHVLPPHLSQHNSTSFLSQSDAMQLDVPLIYTPGGGHASSSVSGSQSFHRSAPPSYIHVQQQQLVPQQQQQQFSPQAPPPPPQQQQQHYIVQSQQPPPPSQHQQLVYVLPSGQQAYLGNNTSTGGTSFTTTSPDHFSPTLQQQHQTYVSGSGYSPQQPQQQQQQQQVLYVIQQQPSTSPSGSTPPHQHQQHPSIPQQQPMYLTPAAMQQHSSGGSSLSQQSSLMYQSSSGSDAFSLYSPQSTQHHHGGPPTPSMGLMSNHHVLQQQQQSPQLGQPQAQQQQVFWVTQ